MTGSSGVFAEPKKTSNLAMRSPKVKMTINTSFAPLVILRRRQMSEKIQVWNSIIIDYNHTNFFCDTVAVILSATNVPVNHTKRRTRLFSISIANAPVNVGEVCSQTKIVTGQRAGPDTSPCKNFRVEQTQQVSVQSS